MTSAVSIQLLLEVTLRVKYTWADPGHQFNKQTDTALVPANVISCT